MSVPQVAQVRCINYRLFSSASDTNDLQALYEKFNIVRLKSKNIDTNRE